MPFTSAQQSEIIATISEHAPDIGKGHCRVCLQSAGFTVAPGFAFMPLQATTRAISWQGSGAPCVMLICRYCANTLFFNMLSLGLDALVNPDPEPPQHTFRAPDYEPKPRFTAPPMEAPFRAPSGSE